MTKIVPRLILILLSIFFLFTIPQDALAHALLENANPGPDSHLESSPKEIVLVFNERLEKELYSIKVFNEDGDIVSKDKTAISKDQKSISETLPILPNGNYAISYRVLSADGHPIKGSYVVSIGKKTVLNSDIKQLDLTNENRASVLFSTLYSIVRVLYYIVLLLTSGWFVWGTIGNKGLEEISASFRQYAYYLLGILLLTTIGIGFFQLGELLDSWTLEGIWTVLSGTTKGLSWFLSMILSISGFAILFRNKWLDRLWVLLILAVKSVNGHAMAFEPPILTISIDILHLIATAIWAGGLFYIVIYWRKQREHVKQFLPVFSHYALICIIVLIISGVALTLIYLPKIHYLLYSNWGILLLIKVSLVLFVIVIGGFLRDKMKKNKGVSIGCLLKIDFSLMILILGIVGVFTAFNPLPQNDPLEWHAKENNIEFITTISPKAPGNNHFMIVANSNKEGIEIKRIELFLKYKDNLDLAPIQVPFLNIEQSKNVQYMVDGKYLPFPGNWTAEIRILDSEDNEEVFRKDFIVY